MWPVPYLSKNKKFLHDSQMALETQFHSNHTDKMHACPHKVVQDFMMPCQTITLLPPALQLLLPIRHIALILFISRDILVFNFMWYVNYSIYGAVKNSCTSKLCAVLETSMLYSSSSGAAADSTERWWINRWWKWWETGDCRGKLFSELPKILVNVIGA